MYSRKWSIEKEALFNELVGKMPDLKLAKKLHVCVKWLAEKRRSLGIPPYYKSKYTAEHIKYIEENYRVKGVREMAAELTTLFPDTKFSQNGIKAYMNDHGLIRSYIDFENIHKRDVESGRHAEVVQKRKDSIGKREYGELYYSNTAKELCIYLGRTYRKPYRIYVWEQHFGRVPHTHMIEIIDKRLPINIDNLRKVPKAGLWENASVVMSDNWIVGLMHKKQGGDKQEYLNNPILIKNFRLYLQAKREIKALDDENRELAPSSKKNA